MARVRMKQKLLGTGKKCLANKYLQTAHDDKSLLDTILTALSRMTRAASKLQKLQHDKGHIS